MKAKPESTNVENDLPFALYASRAKALVRSVCLLVPGVILGLTSVLLIHGSDLTANAVSNRLVDYAMVVLALPGGLVAIAVVFRGLQWLSISLWPGIVGFELSAAEIRMKLGWLCAATYDAQRLEIAYLFEQDENDIEEPFEAHFTEAHQRRYFLPRIVHPDASEPINRTILRQCSTVEGDLALIMQPLLKRWRQQRPSSND